MFTLEQNCPLCVLFILVKRRPFSELWPDLASEEVESNRQRKMKELTLRVKQASVTDLLPVVTVSLRHQCQALELADEKYAAEIIAILSARISARIVDN